MSQRRKNVVVVIWHDTGQHLGCYGAPGVRSPNLDGFAAGGLQFRGNFCTAPQCSPSRAAVWTGRYPHANGVVGLAHAGFANNLHDDERHLAQLLAAAGYQTHLFGLQHVSPSARRCGFEFIHGGGMAAELAGKFEGFLDSRAGDDRPMFIQIGCFETHRPWPHEGVEPLEADSVTVPPYLPDIPEVREDLAEQEACVCAGDRAFGRVVDALEKAGLTDDTIVVFTADHGIAFPRAKMTLYDPGLRTALLMRVPGVPGGRAFDEMISNVDLAPTLLDLLEIPVPDNMQGRSFRGLISGGDYAPNEAVFAEKTYHTYYDPMRAIRTRRWKLIANFEYAPYQETSPDYGCNAKSYVEIATAAGPPADGNYHPPYELYDLDVDPWERNNLAGDDAHMTVRNDLIRQLRGWMTRTGDPLLEGPMAQGCYLRRMADFKGR